MFTLGPAMRGNARPAIQFVAAADSSNSSSLAVPAHAANDYIIAYAKSPAFSTAPAVPSGWTDILYSGANAANGRQRFYGIRDAANSIATLGLPSGTANVAFAIYRNVSGAGLTAISAEALGPTSAATPSLGVLTSGSWVLAGCDINQGETLNDPGGVAHRFLRSVALGGGTCTAFDSNAIVSSYAGGATTTWTTGAFFRAFAIELLNG